MKATRLIRRVLVGATPILLLGGVVAAGMPTHVSPPPPGAWVPKRWKNVGPPNYGGNIGHADVLEMNVGPTWNSITGTGISVTSLMGQKNCSGSQSADGIFMWTVVCPPGATASWTLTATANGTVKCEAQAAVLATADAADHRKLTYTGDAVIAVDLSSHATCDSRTSLTARVSDPKSATGWTTKTANGTTAYCTTKSEIVQASLSVACPSGTATGTTEAVAGGNVGAPLVFTGNVDLNGDGAPDYTVSWSDMGAPGVPKPPPAGDPAGPVIGGTDGSPYGGPNPNGSIPGWEPAPFEPPTGYTPGSPPPSNG